jgi:hypothetical protein
VHLEDNNAESWQARIAWDDFANETNYYRVLAYPMSYVNPTTSRYWTRSVLDWADNDQNRQGARLTTNKLIDNLSLSPYPDRSFHLLFMLLTTDEHYFKYMESIRASSQNNYNPFAEPTFVHTNIEGGLGTFAGYQRFDYEVVRY